MEKPYVIQICFSLNSFKDNNVIREKLLKTKAELDSQYGNGYLLKSCHLTKTICLDAGFDTALPDMFEEIFGDQYESEITETTFEDAKANMNMHREQLSRKACRLVLLADDNIGNVALELKLFSENRIITI